MIILATYGFVLVLAAINLFILIWANRLVRQYGRLNRLLLEIAVKSFMTQHRGTFFAWSALGHYEIKVTAVRDPWKE